MNLDAQWVVGFTDGEGCFHIGIAKHPEMKQGFQILPEFTIVQHEKDVKVLYALKQFFGCGVVRRNHDDRMCWRARKLEHLGNRIIPFFDKHSLKTRKQQDYLVFRRVVLMMLEKHHLTEEGLKEIQAMVSRKFRSECSDKGKVKSSSL